MKAALIPPRGYERTALYSRIHLVLPLPACVTNPEYVRTYKDARIRGDYVILDNGCAEGKLVDGGVLIDFATQLNVHEIVAPDVMGNGPATVRATTDWLLEHPEADNFNIMGVVQGANEDDVCTTLDAFARLDVITTVGIPKVHVKTPGSDARLKIVKYILEYYPGRFKIHLLGLNTNFPTEMLDLAYPTQVRSMDSTQPYKVAELGWKLSRSHSWTRRRPGYFDKLSLVRADILRDNIQTFLKWAAKNES